jgi:hypothetical protein
MMIHAGVFVEGELLPKFTDLLLLGPPPPPALVGTAAAAAAQGATAIERTALAEWRMRRQAQLLAVQEQLSDLPHALEALRYTPWGNGMGKG